MKLVAGLTAVALAVAAAVAHTAPIVAGIVFPPI
jgi:hypothetical protein